MVSIKGPNMATSPSRTGSRVLAAPCAIASVPRPASLEKDARRTPVIITDPITPPAAAFPENASLKISASRSGICARFVITINIPANRYNETMSGTSLDAT